MSSGCRCPCTRTCGGEFVVMWRSLPAMSSIFFSRSLSVTFISRFFFPQDKNLLALRALSGPMGPRSRSPSKLVQSLACSLLQRGNAFRNFDQSTAPQRDHARFNGFLFQFHGRRSNQDQLSYFIVNFHDFIKTRPALVPCAIAVGAALSFENPHGFGFLRGVTAVDLGLWRQRNFFLAFRAN